MSTGQLVVVAAVVVLLLIAMYAARAPSDPPASPPRRPGTPEWLTCVYGDEAEKLKMGLPGLNPLELVQATAEAAEWNAGDCLALIANSVAPTRFARRIGREAIRIIRTTERLDGDTIDTAIGRIETTFRAAGVVDPRGRRRPLAIRFDPEYAATPSTHTPVSRKRDRRKRWGWGW